MFGNLRQSKVRILTDYEKGFIIAAIDGEGSISINEKIFKQKYVWGKKTTKRKGYKQYCPIISISNTNKPFLEKIKKILGVGYFTRSKANVKRNKKESWRFSIENMADIKSLLTQIIDGLIVRKPQAQILLDYCSLRLNKIALHPKRLDLATYGEEEKELVEKIGILNRRGLKYKRR